jgi:LPPG:FO 2-phospho-L-lactate transferase
VISPPTRIVALTGGVGGAKLALGLQRVVPAQALACIVNTGDDFEHLGLHISPDLDTLLYTLSGQENPATGWGRRDETWTFMQVLAQLGGPDWFRLGDGDLAVHVQRTARLAAGETLTAVTESLRRSFGVGTAILPMSDAPVRTFVDTCEHGRLAFQDYFVRHQAVPEVRSIDCEGAGAAALTPAIHAALGSAALEAIIICPSNPWLSIAPLLAIPALPQLLRAAGVPVVAVSPLIGGEAVKGPTARIMMALGLERTPRGIAKAYRGVIDALVIDEADSQWREQCGVPTLVTHTLMDSLARREALAGEVLAFAAGLKGRDRP